MLYILVIIVSLLAMAKKSSRGGRRNWANMKMARIDGSVTLSTLANNTVISGNLTTVSTEAYRAISLNGVWSLRGLTAGEGPVIFGVAHSDYTAAEIEECLEQASGLAKSDKIATEQSNRLVRRIGVLGTNNEIDTTFNDGKNHKTRLNWGCATGQSLAGWAWNKSGGNLTTGAVLQFQGDLLIRWT